MEDHGPEGYDGGVESTDPDGLDRTTPRKYGVSGLTEWTGGVINDESGNDKNTNRRPRGFPDSGVTRVGHLVDQ